MWLTLINRRLFTLLFPSLTTGEVIITREVTREVVVIVVETNRDEENWDELNRDDSLN